MKTLNRADLWERLKSKYPDGWFKDGADFDAAHAGSIWTGEGAMHTDGYELFNYWNESEMYVMGVHHELEEFLYGAGWYAEAHDGGTYFIWPI